MVVAVHLLLGLTLHQVVQHQELHVGFGGRLPFVARLRWHNSTERVVVLLQELPRIVLVI